MDAMIVTEHEDNYQCLEEDTPQDGWDADKWASDFTGIHSQAMKPFRISAMATNCGSEADLEPAEAEKAMAASGHSTYDTLVEATHGSFYNENSSEEYLESAFHDYASKVIFRAFVTAKRQIKLSKLPLDASKIKVTIGGNVIPTNEWSYAASTNAVNLRWELITDEGLKPGDTISIWYPIAGRLAVN
jgi:hypothetical protein